MISGSTRRCLAWRLVAAVLCCCAVTPAAGQVSITRTSGDIFYIDSGDNLKGMYAAYRVTNNTGAALDEMWVGIGSFTGGVVGLATYEDGLVKVGNLANSAATTVFFYLAATGATATAQGHTVSVYDNKPSRGGAVIGSQAFSFTAVEETIAALANKVTAVVTGPNPPGLGGIVTITVTGQTGTVGNSKIVSYSPATWTSWPANAYQLVGTQIVMTGGNTATYTDQLYAVVANKAATDYTATYTFVAVGTTTQPEHVSPVGYIASGTQIKHTDTGSFGPSGTLQPVQPADNKVVLQSKTVDASGITAAGGTATYTLTFQNVGTVDAVVNEVVDTLPSSPASVTYVTSSSTIAGSAVPDPRQSGSTLTWPDGVSIPAGQTRTVTYRVTFPAMPGTYANSAYGLIGTEEIDTTLSTSNQAPASVNVVVPALADLSVDITVDKPSPNPGEVVTFTVTLTNGGPSPAIGVTLAAFTNQLPAGITWGSATPSQGTYDRQFWTVGTLASGASATLQLAFTIGTDGKYRLLAEVSASTYPDPDSTPYDGLGDDYDTYDLTTSGGSGGASAGLESNGTLATTLAQLLFDRRVKAAESGVPGRLPRFQFDPGAAAGKSLSSSDVLRGLIPPDGPEASVAFETSPADLLPVTNAEDVVAVDYLRARDGKRIGAFFGTLTTSGAIYEHTKVICDRLKGAVLTDVRHLDVNGRPFILSRLIHPSGEIDYAITLTAWRTAAGFVVDSRFRLDEYAKPADAADVLNLQIWSVSPAHTAALLTDLLDRLGAVAPVEYRVSPDAPPALPDVYVRTGRYQNGNLKLELYNGAGVDRIRLTGGSMALTERSDRIEFERTVALPPAGADHVVTVDLDLGPVFDASFFVETPNGGRDQMYLADGAWGFTFDGTGARVTEMRVAPAVQETADKQGTYAIERPVTLSGEVKTWAALFRYLQANGQAADLSEYGYVEFTASGEGQARVLFEKESVKTSDHFGTVIKLTAEPRTHRLWFDELRRPDGTGRLDPSDLLLISFYVIGDQGRMRPFELTVSGFRFGGGVGDPLATVPDRYELAQNYPNPFNPQTEITFGMPEAGPARLVVYDMLGRRVAQLVDGWIDAGRHRVRFDGSSLASGVYVYRLETAGSPTVSRTMTLVR